MEPLDREGFIRSYSNDENVLTVGWLAQRYRQSVYPPENTQKKRISAARYGACDTENRFDMRREEHDTGGTGDMFINISLTIKLNPTFSQQR